MSNRKQWAFVLIAVGLLGAGALIGTKLAPDIFPVEVGSRAPDFGAVDLAEGDSVKFGRELAGEVVLLNIWATWCEPCRVEMPSMQRLHEAYADSGLRIVAVSIDEASPDVVRNFRREYGLTFSILQDRSRAIERTYQTTGVPESFVISRDGRIVKKVIGEYDWDSQAARELVSRLLRQPR
jgi:cytochrome c biogenesis protein CcmG/thiol:disulfide interchange protein DsbE